MKPYSNTIMKIFNDGRFADWKFKKPEYKNEMIKYIQDNMKDYYEQTKNPETAEVHEIIRELIKDWIGDNDEKMDQGKK